MGNKKILIVDDDADVCKGMEVRLKANHYDTFFATDAVSTCGRLASTSRI